VFLPVEAESDDFASLVTALQDLCITHIFFRV